MEEEIFEVAKTVTGAVEAEWNYLSSLCAAEAAQLKEHMKKPLDETDKNAFICAAGWLAAADYYCGKGGGAVSWSAGDVRVQERDAAAWRSAAENLRSAAEHLLEGKLKDGGFAFLGVRG